MFLSILEINSVWNRAVGINTELHWVSQSSLLRGAECFPTVLNKCLGLEQLSNLCLDCL